MNNKLLIFISIFLFAIFSCDYEEDHYNGNLLKMEYNLTKGVDGSFQRVIYDFYNKYGSVILTDVTEADYKYNFADTNKIEIINCSGDEKNLRNAYNIFKEIFLDRYSDEFLKENLTFNIIFCEEIIKGSSKLDYYVSSNFIAVANVDSKLLEITEEEKEQRKYNLHIDYWNIYMGTYSAKFQVDFRFYQFSENFYNDDRSGWFDPAYTYEEWYEAGFLPNAYERYYMPNQKKDFDSYLSFMLTNRKEDCQELFETYDLIRKKFDYIYNIFEEQFNIDPYHIIND